MPSQPHRANHEEVELTWEPDLSALGPRRSRQPFGYRAYVPHPIGARDWTLAATTVEALSTAERRCRALEDRADVAGLDTVARQLLRAESVASSRIEGLVLSHRRLAKAAVGREHDVTARSVLGNVAAVERAYDLAARDERFGLVTFTAVHRALFAETQDEALGGEVRERQNWIGGDATSPINAEFVPPPPGAVGPLLEDLAAFCNREDLPPVLQAAVAHVQYETVHPFLDGNGRAGRALIGMVLIRRGVVRQVMPPVSLVLAREAGRYLAGLRSYRYGDPTDWLEFFAGALSQAAEVSERLAERVVALQERWREAAGRPRTGSAAAALIAALPAHPVLDLVSAQAVTGRSDEACRQALNLLERSGVIRQSSVGRRNRVWESVGLFALLDGLEREAGHVGRAPAATG